MDGNEFKDIVEYIRGIAEPMVTAGYDVVLKQVKFEMAWHIVLLIFFIVALMLGIKLLKYSAREIQRDSEWFGGGIVAGSVATIISVIGFLYNVYYVLNTAINPDWVAISMILNLINGGMP